MPGAGRCSTRIGESRGRRDGDATASRQRVETRSDSGTRAFAGVLEREALAAQKPVERRRHGPGEQGEQHRQRRAQDQRVQDQGARIVAPACAQRTRHRGRDAAERIHAYLTTRAANAQRIAAE